MKCKSGSRLGLPRRKSYTDINDDGWVTVETESDDINGGLI